MKTDKSQHPARHKVHRNGPPFQQVPGKGQTETSRRHYLRSTMAPYTRTSTMSPPRHPLIFLPHFLIPAGKKVPDEKQVHQLTSRSCCMPPKIRITPSISCSRRRAQCCILHPGEKEMSGAAAATAHSWPPRGTGAATHSTQFSPEKEQTQGARVSL